MAAEDCTECAPCGVPGCLGDRWDCSVDSSWTDLDGRAPWGEDTTQAILRYLATMTPEEHRAMAEAAAMALDCGAWEGVETENGGWVESGPLNEGYIQWHRTAADFLKRFGEGDRFLGEGMLAFASTDLAQELAHHRGWCPNRDNPALVLEC